MGGMSSCVEKPPQCGVLDAICSAFRVTRGEPVAMAPCTAKPDTVVGQDAA